MNNKLNLCYSMTKKRNKIIEYKEKLLRMMKVLSIGYCILIILLLYFVINSEHYTISLMIGEKLFPNLRRIDSFVLCLSMGLGVSLVLLSGEHGRIKTKYELLRHDIIKDLDSTIIATKICLCKDECTCRENFVKEMDDLDIDIIFKKYVPKQKYL